MTIDITIDTSVMATTMTAIIETIAIGNTIATLRLTAIINAMTAVDTETSITKNTTTSIDVTATATTPTTTKRQRQKAFSV